MNSNKKSKTVYYIAFFFLRGLVNNTTVHLCEFTCSTKK